MCAAAKGASFFFSFDGGSAERLLNRLVYVTLRLFAVELDSKGFESAAVGRWCRGFGGWDIELVSIACIDIPFPLRVTRSHPDCLLVNGRKHEFAA